MEGRDTEGTLPTIVSITQGGRGDYCKRGQTPTVMKVHVFPGRTVHYHLDH